ncbi:MAG: peptidoglycan-binding protein [Pseudomonadota bacterium]
MANPIRPMLGDLALQQAQLIGLEQGQSVTEHEVPGLEGDFLQDLGRVGAAIELVGVQSGPEARDGLDGLREAFRAGDPVSFVADIVSATTVDETLIEHFEISERAGHPDCFGYRFRLREYQPTPQAPSERPIDPIDPIDPPLTDDGTLVVHVVKEGDPNFDPSVVEARVTGTQEDGTRVERAMTDRNGNTWTEDPFPAGSFVASAVGRGAAADGTDLDGEVAVEVRSGETTEATIVLRDGAVIALRFLVHFRFDSAFIEPCLKQVIRQVADFAAEHADLKLVVVGHTDLVGSADYNQSLSERRARSAFAMLRFGNDRATSLSEWDALRRLRTPGTLPAVNDSWGVREYQQILQDRGFYNGSIDGNHGPRTDAAVREFQDDNGLAADGAVGDGTWAALVEAYLAADNLSVPDDRFLPNCPDEFLRWLGCGEFDPVEDTEDAARPNRRTEFLFVRTTALPSDVPAPVTIDLPVPGAGAPGWCLNESNTTRRCCFTQRYPGVDDKEGCTADQPRGPRWTRSPAEATPVFVVRVRIRFEDGTPYVGQYVLTAPDGEYMDGEVRRTSGNRRAGTPEPGTTFADGTFTYPDDKRKAPGVFILEVLDDVVARNAGTPLGEAKGPIVCKRLAREGDLFDVVIVDRAIADIVPRIDLPGREAAGPGIADAPPVVLVEKPHTSPRRQPVLLAVDEPFVGEGRLRLAEGTGKIRLFDAVVGGNEIRFRDGDDVFTAQQLNDTVTLFAIGGPAHSDALGDVHLELALTIDGAPGGTALAAITALELTLDIAGERTVPGIDPAPLSQTEKIDPGRFLQVQNDAFQARRALLIVRRAVPEAFDGTLELTLVGAGLRVFELADEVAAAGQTAVTLPLAIENVSIPGTTTPGLPPGPNQLGRKFWVEAAAVSAAARDVVLQLGVAGLEPDGDRVAMTNVASIFVNQANVGFPFTGDDACMMVSKAITNQNLPGTATFDGPPGATPDPDTFRLQLTGLPSGETPQIRLQSFRRGAPRTDHTFDMVEGTVGGLPAYRIDEHVRLVSNAVDDAHLAHQTVLVRLEDTIRATALLNGSEIARVELPVGRPPAEAGPKAVRTCDIHFVTLAGTSSAPATTVERMSEDWAQLAIRFALVSAETVTPVRNVLTVSGTAGAAGTMTFEMTNAAGTTSAVSVDIASGDGNQVAAQKIATEINGEAGFAATTHAHSDAITNLFVVLVNPRQDVDFDLIANVPPGLVVQEPALNFTNDINLLEGTVLGLNFNDGNLSTLDVIAIGQVNIQLSPGGPILAGATGGDFLATNLPAWQNLCIIQEQAVDASDAIFPYVAGHEVGHAILDGGNAIHHPAATNIFNAGPLPATDTIGGAKRLDEPQNVRARARSGPTTVPPLLRQR